MKKQRKVLSLVLSFGLMLSVSLPAGVQAAEEQDGIAILYTNDVHCTNDEGMSYAAIAQAKADAQASYGENNVTLVDNGDAIQGAAMGTLSNGGWLIDIMNQVGYDYAIPGNHEFDFGMDNFLNKLVPQANCTYLSANFLDKNDKNVLAPYAIENYGDVDVAYVGVTTPQTLSSAKPDIFKDANGNWIYSFCQDNDGKELYKQVQTTVDKARAEGAEYVVVLAHLGNDPLSKPWTSKEVISNTTGIDAVLDGHSHETVESETVKNADGEDVILSQTGSKAANLGKLEIEADGDMTASLTPVADLAQEGTAYDATKRVVEDIQNKYEEVTSEVIGTTEVDLTTLDPATGERRIRSGETNMGDFVTDAYRLVMDTDVAICNGGGIRADMAKGDVTYGDLISVHPYNNLMCTAEVSGQQLADALELSTSIVGEGENGGFLQVSGMRFTIDTSIESTVKTDDEGNFVEVSGARRVKNIEILQDDGTYAPIDLDKTYTVASNNYILKSGGNGYSMFGKNITLLQDETLVDSEVLIDYVQQNLGGTIGSDYANPYGEGRIKIMGSYPDIKDGAWYTGAVQYVTEKDLMGTVDGTNFGPRTEMSRAMAYAVLYRSAGEPEITERRVADTEGKWYDDAINWAASIGLYEGTSFGQDKAISRGQIAHIMTRYARIQGAAEPADNPAFANVPDKNDIPEDQLSAMQYCYNAGIMIGNQYGELKPNNTITRAEFAQVLKNYDEKIIASL